MARAPSRKATKAAASAATVRDLERVLSALGDPVRLALVRNLAKGDELSCRELGGESLPKATLSRHMAVLREAGLVETRKLGPCTMNRLPRAELDARFPGLLDAIFRVPADE